MGTRKRNLGRNVLTRGRDRRDKKQIKKKSTVC